MLPNTMDASKTNNPLEVMDRAHTIFTLRLPQYLVSAFIGTSPNFMRATTVLLDIGSKFSIICRLALP